MQLLLEILQLLQFDRFFFGLIGDAFGARDVFGDLAQFVQAVTG